LGTSSCGFAGTDAASETGVTFKGALKIGVTVVGDGQIGIAEQVRPAGLSTATPRYYEDVGLPTPAGRSQAGYRV
jgi:hypothetical protein